MLHLQPAPILPRREQREGDRAAGVIARPPAGTAEPPAWLHAAATAHDLQTPIAVIKGHTQLLQRWLRQGHPIAETQLREALDAIAADADRLHSMLEELLAQLRSEGDRATPRRELTALEPLVRHAIDACADPRLRLKCWPEPLEGWWEPRRILRVVENLLSNACKYSPAGADIQVVLSRADGGPRHEALFSVRDRGIGIPAAEIPRLFEPFYRASNAGCRRDSAGVGLAGVRQIVEEHGGSVGVVSELGRGTTFTIRLPCLPRA